ncbi:MAG: LPXTG cell wall anchor domain-containing protein, partial [Methanococcoides sp.]|nr:LPXTG cell wall anchor domain-containing protein [Methanococcoides sp.]
QDKELSVYASRPDASQSAVKSNSSGSVNNLLLLTLALLGGAGFVLYKKKKL